MVDICLPVQLHKAVSIAALKAGKHVLVEKPISIRLDDAIEMVEIGKASGRRFMVAHVLPFFRGVRLREECCPERRLRTTARRAFQADHLQVKENLRFGRSREERRPRNRPAHPRHALHPASFAECLTPYSLKERWRPAISSSR